MHRTTRDTLRRYGLGALIVGLVLTWLVVGAMVMASPGPGSPTAVDDITLSLSEDAPTLLDVTANDLASPLGNKTLVAVSMPAPYGQVAVSGTQVLFTPEDRVAPYTTTFTYDIEGDAGDTDTGTVTVTVASDNDPVNLRDHSEYLAEGGHVTGNAGVMLDPDEGGDAYTYAFWDSEGTADPWGWPSNGDYEYYGSNYHEVTTNTYTVMVTDTAGTTDTAYLHFVITGTNEPVVDGTFDIARTEDSGFSTSFSGHEEWFEPLTLSAEISPTYGTLTLYPGEQASWAYHPANRSTSYTDTLTIRLTDTLPSTALMTATITVTADNDLPACYHYGTPSDALVNEPWQALISIDEQDVDQTIHLDLVSAPGWVSVKPNDPWSVVLTGTPSMSDEGEAMIVARPYDGLAYGNTITLTFDVEPLHQTAYVDGTLGTDGIGQGAAPGVDAYRTISHALERTTYTGTIRVAPGTYGEGITISQEISLEPTSEGGSGERVILDGSTSAYDLGILVYGSRFSVTGFDIVDAERGIHVNPGSSDVSFRWCNVEGNATGLSAPYATDTVDARYNYWGSPDGPSGQGPGSGDSVTENVLFEPWLRARVGSVVQRTVLGTDTLDAAATVGLSATLTSTAPVTLTLAQYESNPREPFLYNGIHFWDVQILDGAHADAMVVRFFIDPGYLGTINFDLSKIMVWDTVAETWLPCSHQQWHWSDDDNWWDAIDVTFGADTVPSLSALTGTEFGFRALPYLGERGLSMARTGGPAVFGPGWNLRYRMVVSNTAHITLHHVVITDVVPNWSNWHEISGDLGQPTVQPMDGYAYHVYDVDELAPGEILTQRWTYHTPSSMVDGRAFIYEAWGSDFEGSDPFVGLGAICDHSLLAPTPSPTPQHGVALPMVTK